MAKQTVDIVKLASEAENLQTLIRESEKVLKKVSAGNLLAEYLAPRLLNLYAFPYVPLREPLMVELVVKAVSDSVVNSKTRERLLGYYQELAVKQSKLIQRHEEIARELEEALRRQRQRQDVSEQSIAQLRDKLSRLETALKKITDFQNRVR